MGVGCVQDNSTHFRNKLKIVRAIFCKVQKTAEMAKNGILAKSAIFIKKTATLCPSH